MEGDLNNVDEQDDLFENLRAFGMTREELALSRKKLANQVSAIDPTAKLSEQVEYVLLELGCKFVESAAKFGCKLAQHRGYVFLSNWPCE